METRRAQAWLAADLWQSLAEATPEGVYLELPPPAGEGEREIEREMEGEREGWRERWRERERKRERDGERDGERERGMEREIEREMEGEGEGERERWREREMKGERRENGGKSIIFRSPENKHLKDRLLPFYSPLTVEGETE